jgi:hypothetical protein
MGVFSPPGNSSLMKSGTADKGVFADRAESSDGKVAVTGVVSCASFGLVAGMANKYQVMNDWR